jgi:hypothetical protein
MLSKTMLRYTVSVLGWVFFLSLSIGIPSAIANDGCNIYGCFDDCEFTTDFRLGDCKFKNRGINPYFILKPGYRLVLETPEDAEDREKSVETVLCDTKWINLDGRWIKTRVLEERAFEWDEDEGEWVNIEISLNWFAICKKTNAVYYFGEWSRDCEDGFDENDVCPGEESNEGSWEAGVDGARPGLIMAGTPLLGAKYFQEIAPPEAVDRGEIVDMGLDVNVPAGVYDSKIYCPGVGLVQDQDLELVWYGFVDCDDDDDNDDDDKRRKRRFYHRRF